MDQADRRKILQNIEKLIQYTDYDELMRECIKRKLLFDVMQEQIEVSLVLFCDAHCTHACAYVSTRMRARLHSIGTVTYGGLLLFASMPQIETPDRRTKHKLLLEKITRRGPKAFAAFTSILMDKFPDAYDYFNHLDSVYGEISLNRRHGNATPQCVSNNYTPWETRRECSPPEVKKGNYELTGAHSLRPSTSTATGNGGRSQHVYNNNAFGPRRKYSPPEFNKGQHSLRPSTSTATRREYSPPESNNGNHEQPGQHSLHHPPTSTATINGGSSRCSNNNIVNPQRTCSPPETNGNHEVAGAYALRPNSPPAPSNGSPSNEQNGNLAALENLSLRPTTPTGNGNFEEPDAHPFEPQPTNGLATNGSGGELRLEEFTVPLKSRHNYTVTKSTKYHGLERGSKVSTYPMKSKTRGVLFLVNIINFEASDKRRNGADADRDNLVALFRGMGFKIFYYENLKRDVSVRHTHFKKRSHVAHSQFNSQEFVKLVDQLVVSSHLRTTDCLVFGLLTHGERDYISFNVEFSDLHKMDVEDILAKFSNKNCDRLMGKPKIFIFPFCRYAINR